MIFLKKWKTNWELKSLTKIELFNVIVEVITKQLDEIEKSEINLEANLVNDYEADSVDIVAILLYLEDMFKNASSQVITVVPTDKLGEIVLVEDIFDIIYEVLINMETQMELLSPETFTPIKADFDSLSKRAKIGGLYYLPKGFGTPAYIEPLNIKKLLIKLDKPRPPLKIKRKRLIINYIQFTTFSLLKRKTYVKKKQVIYEIKLIINEFFKTKVDLRFLEKIVNGRKKWKVKILNKHNFIQFFFKFIQKQIENEFFTEQIEILVKNFCISRKQLVILNMSPYFRDGIFLIKGIVYLHNFVRNLEKQKKLSINDLEDILKKKLWCIILESEIKKERKTENT